MLGSVTRRVKQWSGIAVTTSDEVPTSDEVAIEDEYHLARIHKALHEAAHAMDLGDVPEDLPEDEAYMIYEERFHCGSCVVNAVMDIVWPSLQAYHDFLKAQKP
jgi:hypothetical protein